MRNPVVLVVAAVLLTGCSGSTTTTTPTSSAAPSPPASSTSGATPTAEQTAWAGQVCTATLAVQKDAEGLASAATSGGDVEAQLKAQMAAIQTSTHTLATTVTAVPASIRNDPELAQVRAAADQLAASVAAAKASATALEGKSGLSKAQGLATVSSAAGTALSKLGATAQAIKDAAREAKTVLGKAFAAAPSCATLNSE
jgi:hypothetical protein